MPDRNENDLLEIPKKLRQGVNFIQVEQMEEVLDAALLPPAKAPKLPRRQQSKKPKEAGNGSARQPVSAT